MDNLDLEYVQTLHKIRPYITRIVKPHLMELVKVWVEKLSSPNWKNKALRNRYLIELGNQIEVGMLGEPFMNPPHEELVEFNDAWKFSHLYLCDNRLEGGEEWKTDIEEVAHTGNNSMSNCDESAKQKCTAIRDNTTNIPLLEIWCKKPRNTKQEKKRRNQVNVQSKNSCNVFKSTKIKHNPHNLYTLQNEDIQYEENSFKRSPKFKNDILPVYDNRNGFDENCKDNDSTSWCDLTECSTNGTEFGSGDLKHSPKYVEAQLQNMYEEKINQLDNVIQGLKEENGILRDRVEKYEKKLTLKNSRAETSLHNLAIEVEGLKNQLQDLADIKKSVQLAHITMASEWQITIYSLHNKLETLQHKNEELKTVNNNLSLKLQEANVEKEKELGEVRAKLDETNTKEVNVLKDLQAKYLSEIEVKYIKLLEERDNAFKREIHMLKDTYDLNVSNIKDKYESKINDLENEFEGRLKSFHAEYQSLIKTKENEVEHLENMLQEKCSRMCEEVQMIRGQIASNVNRDDLNYLDKIVFLQKCVLKMEKLYRKSEKEHDRRITELKQEIELMRKSEQLTLITQRGNVLSQSFANKHDQINDTISQLEKHYKNVLLEHQQRALEDKKRDTETISLLRDELIKCKSQYIL